MSKITPDYVLKLTKPTDGLIVKKWIFYNIGFLCPLNANTAGIDFIDFKIRDVESKRVYFDAKTDHHMVLFNESNHPDDLRTIRYQFPREMLKASHIGTT